MNPGIDAEPGRADEVIYNLRAILLAVQTDGLVRASETFMSWLRGEKPCPSERRARAIKCDSPWQHTSQGERPVQKELRRTLLKYRLHTDQELFDRAYAYIRQYY